MTDCSHTYIRSVKIIKHEQNYLFSWISLAIQYKIHS